jgi:hypothetical protein
MRLLDRLSRRRFVPDPGAERPSRVGQSATDLQGPSPEGTPVDVRVAAGSVALLFLTTSCLDCRLVWTALAATPGQPIPSSVLIVTPSPSTEDARAVAALAPPQIPVLMASEVWQAYAVTGAPWCVVVVDGVVVHDRAAPTDTDELRAVVDAGRA